MSSYLLKSNLPSTGIIFLQLATSLPRICFLSGLSGEEMMMFIDAFPETGIWNFLNYQIACWLCFLLRILWIFIFDSVYYILSQITTNLVLLFYIFFVSICKNTSDIPNWNAPLISAFFWLFKLGLTFIFVEWLLIAGLEPAVFAALVPNSADTPLRELIEEIMGDHEMLVSQLNIKHVHISLWNTYFTLLIILYIFLLDCKMNGAGTVRIVRSFRNFSIIYLQSQVRQDGSIFI